MKIRLVTLLLTCAALLTLHSLAYSQWHLENYLTITGKTANEQLGSVVKGVGDYDHDGNIEVAVADWPYTDIWSITAHTDTVPKARFRGVILEKGDINGDGYPDFVIGKPAWIGAVMDSVFIYFGDSTGIDTIPDLILQGENMYDNFGHNLAIGDINNDGVNDLIIGAPGYPANNSQGRIYIYYGRSIFLSHPDLILTGSSSHLYLGLSCKIGDINADGIADLIVTGIDSRDPQHSDTWFNYIDAYFGGTPFDTTVDFRLRGIPGYTNGYGFALMDANGDAHTDILWMYEDTTKTTKLRIYYGGSSLDTIPDFTIPPPRH
jgi:hypothetical protein